MQINKEAKENDKPKKIPVKKMASIFYGWQDIRPKSLQWLNRPHWFLVIACVAVFLQSMSVNGLISVSITTLERRFGFTSKEAGLLPSFYDIFGLPAVLVVSCLGNKSNKPRWIASGMFLIGVGSIIFALPHFFTSNYHPSGSGGENSICNSLTGGVSNVTCEAGASSLMSTASNDWYFIYMFLVGILFLGVGSVPLYVLAVTYFDDCLPRDKAAMYVGIFYALGTIGPAVAFLGGGYMLNYHTDIDQGISEGIINTLDPRWVGAWWLLFLVTGVLALLVVIPMYGFPRMMNTCAEVKKNRVNEAHANVIPNKNSGNTGNTDSDLSDDTSLKNMPATLLALFKNPTFVAMLLAGVGDVAMISGFVAFGPKYIQNQFSLSPAATGRYFGMIAIPGAAGGSFIGSLLIKKLNMTCKQCLKWQFWISVLTLGFLGLFLIQCKQPPFVGVNVDQTGRSLSKDLVNIQLNCSSNCACNQYKFDPICGNNDVTYFSSCHAGCQENHDSLSYSNCSCITEASTTLTSTVKYASTSTTFNNTAVSGMCTEESCTLFWLFCLVFFGAMFLIYVTGMFHLSILVRIVPYSQREIALCLDMIVSRLFGSIPSPIVFGAIIDYSCLLWEKKECADNNGNCIYYANSSMSWYMMIMCVCCQLLVTVTCYVAMVTYRQTTLKSQASDDRQVITFDNSAMDITDTEEGRRKSRLKTLKTNFTSDTSSNIMSYQQKKPTEDIALKTY